MSIVNIFSDKIPLYLLLAIIIPVIIISNWKNLQHIIGDISRSRRLYNREKRYLEIVKLRFEVSELENKSTLKEDELASIYSEAHRISQFQSETGNNIEDASSQAENLSLASKVTYTFISSLVTFFSFLLIQGNSNFYNTESFVNASIGLFIFSGIILAIKHRSNMSKFECISRGIATPIILISVMYILN